MAVYVLYLLANMFVFALADPLPQLKKCALPDGKCIKQSANALISSFVAGMPELGVKPLDPVHVDKIDASSPNLKLVLTDATFTGIKGCVVKKVIRDVEKSTLTAKLQCDLQLDGHYDMDGQLLILPLKGNGKVHATLRKVIVTVNLDLKEVEGKDGKKHWDIPTWTHSYELKDKADVLFENLFEGNEVLGRAAREVIASSGNEIVIEVGPPVVKAVATVVVENINSFFAALPVEDLVA